MTRRKIVVKDNDFEYFVGHQHACIWTPDGTKRVFTIADIKDISQYDFERGKEKKSSDGMLTPSEVAHFIDNRTTGKNLDPL